MMYLEGGYAMHIHAQSLFILNINLHDAKCWNFFATVFGQFSQKKIKVTPLNESIAPGKISKN